MKGPKTVKTQHLKVHSILIWGQRERKGDGENTCSVETMNRRSHIHKHWKKKVALPWTSIDSVDNRERVPFQAFLLKCPEFILILSSNCRALLSICQEDIMSPCSFAPWTLACVLWVAVFVIGIDLYVYTEAKVNECLSLNCGEDRLWYRAVSNPALSVATHHLPILTCIHFVALSDLLKREQHICLFSLLYFDFSCGHR